jgi:NDP-sugar pyrophosphorylase family protein
MHPSPTLVIMAAGAARRYGGLKQLAPVGPAGQALMEYSIYDALRAEFGRIVLVVRREFESAFREKFADCAAKKIDIQFAYQEPDAYVPSAYGAIERAKPWGTAHAVLCAKPHVPSDFAVMNADDFYGQSAIETIGSYLATGDQTDTGAMVGYQLQNTLSNHGTVNRGVSRVDAEGWLSDIIERFEIARKDDQATSRDAAGVVAPLAIDATVSMNLWGFPARLLELLERGFAKFLAAGADASTEFELPTYVKHLMESGELRVRVLPTDEKWCGMTYQDDVPAARARIAQLVDQGIYPGQLW